MTENYPHLEHPPIVEVVLDIDCNMQPNFNLAKCSESLQEKVGEQYPNVKKRHLMKHTIRQEGESQPNLSVEDSIDAFQFIQKDDKQLFQIRRNGFSFNRLAPYHQLDDYLGEVQRLWELYLTEVKPQHIRDIKLRYINRIELPLGEGELNLDRYLHLGPRVPDDARYAFTRFMRNEELIDKETQYRMVVTLASEPQQEPCLPVILDITGIGAPEGDSLSWGAVETVIQSLREMKNNIFYKTLTKDCLELFK